MRDCLVFQMSHITQRQLQELWTWRTTTGRGATRCFSRSAGQPESAPAMFTNSGRDAMAHFLSAETDVIAKMALRFGEETAERSANPANVPFYFERSQAGREESRQAAEDLR